jgi:hypothetical protein
MERQPEHGLADEDQGAEFEESTGNQMRPEIVRGCRQS